MTEAEMKELAWDLADGHLNSVAQAEAILAALLRAKESGEREERERNWQDIENLSRAIAVRNDALERYENGENCP
jgi:hypothetical protein